MPSSRDADADAADAAAGPRLPSWLLQRDDGLFVDLKRFGGSEGFRHALGQMFEAGMYVRGLDYEAFQRLAFELEPDAVDGALQAFKSAGRPAQQRLGDAVEHLQPARIGLYKGVKLVGDEAFYLFEPLVLEYECEQPPPEADTADEPPPAQADEGGQPAQADDGGQPAARTAMRVVQEKTQLDLDEFVAQMWLKGVRYGLDVAAVSRAIGEGHLGRLVVARARAPVTGRDAGVQEVSEALHRDDAPRVLAGGRVDLSQFSNRFPQIKGGARLIRKIPMERGVDGRDMAGELLKPPPPTDFDLESLAGPGTRIEADASGQYLVAIADGFLTIDAQSHQFSVTEKIINREGVSARTTGDLVLMGDEYEEHGEIQERRTVEGKTITAYANVFGRIVSTGGVITIKKNLSGGAAINRNGPVIVEGLAANAFIQAPAGEVRVARAENCVIVGRKVTIEGQAIACDILGDELDIAVSVGSALGGRSIAIDTARPRGQIETLVSVLLPDLITFAESIDEARAQLVAEDEAEAKARAEMEAVRSQPEVAKYLLLMSKIREQKLTLTAEQKPALQKLGERVVPQLKGLRTLSQQAHARELLRNNLHARIAEHERERDAVSAGISCRIAHIEGDVIVRTLTAEPCSPSLMGLPASELRARLRASTQAKALLYDGAQGEFEWCWARTPES